MPTRQVIASSPAELHQLIAGLTWDGYLIKEQGPTGAVLRLPRSKGRFWIVTVFFFPPIILFWALFWACRPTHHVVVTLAADPNAGLAAVVGQRSPDGRRFWDGVAWIDLVPEPDAPFGPTGTAGGLDAAGTPFAGVLISPDGTRYWDGSSWRPVSGVPGP